MKPKSVTINSAKVKAVKAESLQASADVDYKKLSWSWDKIAGIVYIKVPDTGTGSTIRINMQIID